MRSSTSLTLLTAALLSAGLAQAANGFNTLPYVPYSISDDGKTVVGEDILQDQLWMWTAAAGVTYIGGKTSINPGAGNVLISGDGSRIVGAALDSSTGKRRPSYYDVATGVWTHLGDYGSSSTGSFSATGVAWAMSGNGNLVGGYGYNGGAGQANIRATIWNVATGTLTDLGPSGLSGPNALTRLNAMSDDGRVAGGRGGNANPMIWTDLDGDGSYTTGNISTITGKSVGTVQAISADGVWAGGGGGTGTANAAYRYNVLTQTLESLGTVNASLRKGTATAMSADGSVIVGYEDNGSNLPQERVGFIWRAGVGIQSFDSFLAGQGIDVNDTFNFATPMDISADGLSFTGFGYAIGSSIGQGWQVSIAAAVPEASTYAMLMAGLGVLGFVARRRRAD